jgi:hypothetical protein
MLETILELARRMLELVYHETPAVFDDPYQEVLKGGERCA